MDSIRFSDDELINFHNQFTAHIEEYRERSRREDERFQMLLDSQERTITALNLVVEETSGLVQLSKDWQGAARIGSGIQKFGIWLLKWPLIGTGLYTGFNWIVEHLTK